MYVKYKFDPLFHSFILFWDFFDEYSIHFACFPTSLPLTGVFVAKEDFSHHESRAYFSTALFLNFFSQKSLEVMLIHG
jgi:hypothetical protein